MSDEATVATSDAPVVTPDVVVAPVIDAPVVAAVEAPKEVRKGRRSMREMERSIYEKSRKRRETEEAAAVPVAEPAVEPVVEPVAEPVAVEPVVDDPNVVNVEPTAEPAEPATEPAANAPAFVSVPIDPKNPSSQGQADLKFVDELSARIFRSYKNNDARQIQADADKARAELATARQELAKLYDKDDRTEADKVAWGKWEASADGQAARAEYQRIAAMEKDGDVAAGTAALYWKGASSGYQDTAKVEYQTRADARAAERGQREAQQWIAEAKANQGYLSEAIRNHPEYQTWFNKAVKSFDSELQLGHIADVQPGNPESMHVAFKEFFRTELFRHKAAINTMTSSRTQTQQQEQAAAKKAAEEQRQIAKYRKDAVEEFKAKLASERSNVPPVNPIGNLANVSRVQAPVVSSSDGYDPSQRPPRLSKREREDRVKQRSRDRQAGVRGT